ncbi:MAG TPA: hypothetical protein DHW02_17500, partial [Ktedonobacter sp.]|nr:hypothetical protein [Ktedonobacter sp.]
MAEATFQQVSGDVIISAFNILGGDYNKAVEKAKTCNSVDEWVMRQATQAAAIGATAAAIPGAHLAALTVDVAILMHKMAWCSWGIG